MALNLQRQTPKGGSQPPMNSMPAQPPMYGQPSQMAPTQGYGQPQMMPSYGQPQGPMGSMPGVTAPPGPMMGIMQGQMGSMQGQQPIPGPSAPPMQTMPGMMQQPMYGQMAGMPQMATQIPSQMGVGMNPPLASPGSISLVKGQNMSITKAAPGLVHSLIGLGWDVRQTAGAAFDLDTSCFLLNSQGKVSKPQDFIFYNNKQSVDGSVYHHGDNLTGVGEGDDEQLSVDLSRVPYDIQRIVFAVSVYEAATRGQNFGMVQRAFIRILDGDTKQEIVRYDLTEEASMLSCMLFGELYRYGNEWKFKALGQGIQGGLQAAAAQFGLPIA